MGFLCPNQTFSTSLNHHEENYYRIDSGCSRFAVCLWRRRQNYQRKDIPIFRSGRCQVKGFIARRTTVIIMIMQIIVTIVLVIWSGYAGFVLLSNAVQSQSKERFGGLFHRCTMIETILLSPGLIWVVPVIFVAYMARKFK